MDLVTILTPTYNRAKLLSELFCSLQNIGGNFKWLIVDDGSTDNTKYVVEKFKIDAKFDVNYVRKKNGGKHTAVNYGMKLVDTELVMIVDSDDCLLPNALNEIEIIHKKYANNPEIGVYSFLKCLPNGDLVVSVDEEEFVGDYIKYRIKGKRSGDMAEVFKSNVIKKYPFPEFENEKFISEDVAWISIAKEYKFVFIKKAIYQCEYRQGGLTDNDKPMKFAAPMGSMLRGKQLMSKQCGLPVNLKGAIIYNCYSMECEGKVKLDNIREKILVLITKPLGLYYNRRWKN